MFKCPGNCCSDKDSDKCFKKLSDLKVGQSGEIIEVSGKDDLRMKVMEMGLIHGTRIKVMNKAPLNDPIAINIRGYNLSLRNEEADAVLVNVNPIMYG